MAYFKALEEKKKKEELEKHLEEDPEYQPPEEKDLEVKVTNENTDSRLL